jgi:hypothetical protein
MKILPIAGILLILGGAYVLVRGLSYTKSRDTVELGPLKASVESQQVVPTWVGGLAITAGLVMVIAGAGARKRS